MDVILSAQALRCTVGGRMLWHGLDLSVRAAERWAIAGPSGSGKSLLLRTLAGLVTPQAGEIGFEGRPLTAWHMPEYRARVAYVMQRPALPEGRVRAALAAPFALRVHRDKHYSDEMARGYLAAVGMAAAFLEQDTGRLSGGEAQIVNLLRALLIAPRVLLLDEPTAALDPARTACVEALVQAWLHETGDRACLWVSHDATQRARVSDHELTLGAAA